MRFMRARGRSLCELGQTLRNFQRGHLEITLKYVIETCSVPVLYMWYESTRDTRDTYIAHLNSQTYPLSRRNLSDITRPIKRTTA